MHGGVADPCLEIAKNPHDAFKYTTRGNLVAVVSNGTAVLGLGDIGADGSSHSNREPPCFWLDDAAHGDADALISGMSQHFPDTIRPAWKLFACTRDCIKFRVAMR